MQSPALTNVGCNRVDTANQMQLTQVPFNGADLEIKEICYLVHMQERVIEQHIEEYQVAVAQTQTEQGYRLSFIFAGACFLSFCVLSSCCKIPMNDFGEPPGCRRGRIIC